MTMTSNGTETTIIPEILPSYRFWIEIEGILEAAFTECSGLQVSTETYQVKEGGLNSHVHHLPVRTTFSNITLKRGLSNSTKFWDWYKQTVDGKVERLDISIILYSANKPSTAAQTWLVSGAFPVKWSGPTLNVKTHELSVETLELAYDWFKLTI